MIFFRHHSAYLKDEVGVPEFSKTLQLKEKLQIYKKPFSKDILTPFLPTTYVFKINYQSYSISDSICSLKVYEGFKKSDIPNIIQTNYSTEGRPDFYFKDINFDNVEELIITETGLEEYNSPVYRVFEFQNNELIELKDFPSISLHEGKGNIDYEKKEITTKDYYSCCEYEEDFYKYEKNNKEQFVYFKTLHHIIDPNTENEEIIIKEKGKADIKIFKKKQ